MSLADDAKILLIPSGYKTSTPYGTLYSVFPTDGEQDFQIDRSTTASRVNQGGLIEQTLADTPRVDHLGGGCPSVLIEPGRTNLYYDSTGWNGLSQVNITFTDTTNIVAPDGSVDNVKLMTATSTSQPRFDESIPLPGTDKKYTTSIFVKKNTGRYVAIAHFSDSTNAAIFDLDNGSIHYQHPSSLGLAKIENYGNGWYRISLPMQITSGATYNVHKICLSDGVNWYTGSVGDSIYCWGFQIEEYVGATGYIPTTLGTASRSVDNLECTTSYTLGTDATFYFDFEAYSYDSSFRQCFMVRNSAFTQYIDFISYEDSGIYYFRARASANGGTQNYLIGFGERDVEFFQRNKLAIRLYENNYEIYVNGSQMKTGTSSAGNFDVVDGISIVNDFGAASDRPGCKLYDFRVYDKTMTQSELETLTTI